MTTSDSFSFRSAGLPVTLAAICGLGAVATAWALHLAFDKIEHGRPTSRTNVARCCSS
jgi:hypothetical protein